MAVISAIYTNKEDDFLLTASLETSLGDYEVEINKTGFVKDHPDKIKDIIGRICYFARFDQELHQFQLNRKSWKLFKDLFEAVTGFKIEEQRGVFSDSADPVPARPCRFPAWEYIPVGKTPPDRLPADCQQRLSPEDRDGKSSNYQYHNY